MTSDRDPSQELLADAARWSVRSPTAAVRLHGPATVVHADPPAADGATRWA